MSYWEIFQRVGNTLLVGFTFFLILCVSVGLACFLMMIIR